MEFDPDTTLNQDVDLQPLMNQVKQTIPQSAARTTAGRRATKGVADPEGERPAKRTKKNADAGPSGSGDKNTDGGPSGSGGNVPIVLDHEEAEGREKEPEKEGTSKPTKAGGRKKAPALSAEELAAARIGDLQLLGTGAKKSELTLQWEEEQIQRVYAAAQLHNLEERNEVLRKQAKAMDKHNSTAVLEVRKLEAEAKMAEHLTEKEALKHAGWADVKIKGFEARIVEKSKDDLAHQRRCTLRKAILEQYLKDPTPQNFRALELVYQAD